MLHGLYLTLYYTVAYIETYKCNHLGIRGPLSEKEETVSLQSLSRELDPASRGVARFQQNAYALKRKSRDALHTQLKRGLPYGKRDLL